MGSLVGNHVFGHKGEFDHIPDTPSGKYSKGQWGLQQTYGVHMNPIMCRIGNKVSVVVILCTKSTIPIIHADFLHKCLPFNDGYENEDEVEKWSMINGSDWVVAKLKDLLKMITDHGDGEDNWWLETLVTPSKQLETKSIHFGVFSTFESCPNPGR